MNKYLLDTHIFLWSLLDPSYLVKQVANELDDAGNELWLSPITTWETIILSEKGRVQLDAPPIEWMNDVLSTLPFQEAAINHEVAMQSRAIHLPHQDPADRFIAASAKVYNLILVTADRHLVDYASGYAVLANM